MKAKQSGHFFGHRNCHIIFNSVQSTQHQVEHAHRIPKCMRQLLDDNWEAEDAQLGLMFRSASLDGKISGIRQEASGAVAQRD